MNTRKFIALLALMALLLSACAPAAGDLAPSGSQTNSYAQISEIPEYNGQPYVVLNDNEPVFDLSDAGTVFETYSNLDALGRCGVAYANLCPELMPTENRESIRQVTPSGWVQAQYDIVSGGSLYNRAHLIGFQLAGENANEKNLITGTRYMNTEGMLPFEDLVADYIRETDNHVLYRVTPIYEGNDLVARGVEMEAWSVEDEGDGVCFHVYVYNVQPGIEIDYATGESRLAAGQDSANSDERMTYVLNTSSKKFHLPTCSSVETIAEQNRQEVTATRDELLAQGYDPCKICDPLS